MSTGPTTEGSIVAYLRLDTSDWNEQLDRAEARARELGRTDPTITVDANVADAMAKIDAVKAAEAGLGGKDVSIRSGNSAGVDAVAAAQKRLEVAERAAANAASTQYLAELRLEEVQKKGGASAYTLAAAEEAVARSSRNAEAAEARQIAATAALTDAQHATARAALEAAAASEVEATAQETAGAASSNAAGQSIRGMQGQTVAIAAVAALIGPLTAAVAGLGGAFLVEGAVGVAAIAGIKKEMADGTAAGEHYSAGLTQLQGDLSQLESTAANGVLNAFESSVATVNQAMPQLNAETHEFAGMLGQSGSNLLDGVVSGLQVAKPLLEEGAGIIQEWTAEFKDWVGNGGLKSFVEYAQAQLPRVAATLESLAKDAVMLGEDLTPLSNDIMDIANAVEPLLSALNSGDKAMQGLGAASPVFKVVGDAVGDATNPIQGLTHALSMGQQLIDQWTGASQKHTTASADAAAAAKAEDLATRNLAAGYGMSAAQLKAAEGAQKQNADQAAATTRQLQLENDAASLLTNAFTLLNGGTLGVAQAQTGAAAATNSLIDSLKNNKDVIDGNTQAAVANQQAIQQKVQADQQSAEAIAKQTGSTQAGTAAFAASKQALLDQLSAQGLLTPAIQAYIDKLYAIPAVVPTKVDLDAAAAIQRAQELKSWLDSLTPKTVVVTVQTNQVGAPANAGPTNTVQKYATGGSVAPVYLASGGDPLAQGTDTVRAMLTPGEFVVKQKAASYDPQFLKSYNDNPAAALASVASKGKGGGTFTGDLYLSSGEFLGMVRGVVRETENERSLADGAGLQREWGA
jgi:hypothetical protein